MNEEPESWFHYPRMKPGWYRSAVAADEPQRLDVGSSEWSIERRAADSSGSPVYSLIEDGFEIATTSYRNVARRWLGLEPEREVTNP